MLVFRLIVACALGASLGCSGPALERFDYAQVIMGVRVNIAAYSASEQEARDAARRAFAEMARIDAILSDFRPDSEAMRLCDAAGSGPVPVSPTLADVLGRSLEFSRASDGAFDVTSGSLVRLWREARRNAVLPGQNQLRSARSTAGWRKVAVLEEPRGCFQADLGTPGIRLDFGGVGKGYAADAGLAEMRKAGVGCALVAVAGDIAAGEAPPGRSGWRIEIPEGGTRGFIEVVNRGVSTSGDTEQFVEIDGVRYSHIVDPRTGLGMTRGLLVTTVAPDATSADAAATTLCVLEPARHGAFLGAFPGVEARVRFAGGGPSDDRSTPGFPAIVRERPLPRASAAE